MIQTIKWQDDFLGKALDPKYNVSVTANIGNVRMSSSPAIGGWLQMYTTGAGLGAARVRLGEEPGSSPFDYRNFSAANFLRGFARVFANMNTGIQLTAGFVGLNDPMNVIAAIYDPAAGQWLLETNENGNRYVVQTGFAHSPGTPVLIEIIANPSLVILKINGVERARSAALDCIPTSGLAWEFQVFNRASGSGWTAPSYWADFVEIEQTR